MKEPAFAVTSDEMSGRFGYNSFIIEQKQAHLASEIEWSEFLTVSVLVDSVTGAVKVSYGPGDSWVVAPGLGFYKTSSTEGDFDLGFDGFDGVGDHAIFGP